MSHIKIRTIALLAFIILLGTQMSCSFNSLYYSVMVINQTDDRLDVYPINIYDSKDVRVGEMQPNGRASYSPLDCTPNKQVNIKWRNIKTQKEYQATVEVKLPREFTKKNGRAIFFYLDKDNNIKVTYEVFNKKIGDVIELKSPDSE